MAARDLRLAVAYGVGALASIAVGSAFATFTPRAAARLIALAAAAAFLLLAQFSIRSAANGLAKVVSVTGQAAGMAFAPRHARARYLLIAADPAGMLDVPIQHLLLGVP